ncbi:MAG: LysM peptidoglycan-binding domain-containing protein [Gammaproteobacteria bacterium]
MPTSKSAEFSRALASLAPEERIAWRRYVVRTGDTLSEIAMRNHLATSTLRRANSLRGDFLRKGQHSRRTRDSLPCTKRRFTLEHLAAIRCRRAGARTMEFHGAHRYSGCGSRARNLPAAWCRRRQSTGTATGRTKGWLQGQARRLLIEDRATFSRERCRDRPVEFGESCEVSSARTDAHVVRERHAHG